MIINPVKRKLFDIKWELLGHHWNKKWGINIHWLFLELQFNENRSGWPMTSQNNAQHWCVSRVEKLNKCYKENKTLKKKNEHFGMNHQP